MSNQETADAMVSHHHEMAQTLQERVQELGSNTNTWSSARDHIVDYLLEDVLPHAKAEESTIYEVALQYEPLVALVQSMIWEHTVICDLAHALKEATHRDGALMAAAQAERLFEVHAEKENRFIIADLTPRPGVNLDAILGAMCTALAG